MLKTEMPGDLHQAFLPCGSSPITLSYSAQHRQVNKAKDGQIDALGVGIDACWLSACTTISISVVLLVVVSVTSGT